MSSRKYKIWYSPSELCQNIISNLKAPNQFPTIELQQLIDSESLDYDAFRVLPNYIKDMYRYSMPEIVVELDSEPILCIGLSQGHQNAEYYDRIFLQLAASSEQGIPFLLYMKVDNSNDLMEMQDYYLVNLKLFLSVTEDYRTPALVFLHNLHTDSFYKIMYHLVQNPIMVQSRLTRRDFMLEGQRSWMQLEFYKNLGEREIGDLAPLTAARRISTNKLLNYMSRYVDNDARNVSELLASRKETAIYQYDSKKSFASYGGILLAIDYIMCRCGKTFKERDTNLVVCFGDVTEEHDTICLSSKGYSVDDFIKSTNKNSFKKFSAFIPSYFGHFCLSSTTYASIHSEMKNVWMPFSFVDAIVFGDGALWSEE